jgi:uncharacterized membrane protein YqjE
MAESGTPGSGQRAGNGAGGESLGDLVSLAVKDVSQLIKWEIDLAKLELRDDVKRLGITGAMLGVAGAVGCMVIVLVSFAAAYALMSAGLPGWAAFLSVAGVYVLIAAVAVLIGVTKMRRMTGLRRTRASVQGSLAALRSVGNTGSGG